MRSSRDHRPWEIHAAILGWARETERQRHIERDIENVTYCDWVQRRFNLRPRDKCQTVLRNASRACGGASTRAFSKRKFSILWEDHLSTSLQLAGLPSSEHTTCPTLLSNRRFQSFGPPSSKWVQQWTKAYHTPRIRKPFEDIFLIYTYEVSEKIFASKWNVCPRPVA